MIKSWKLFSESITNISNKKTDDITDKLFNLNSRELGKYLNTWFPSQKVMASDSQTNRVKLRRGEIENYLVAEDYWTVKKIDKETSKVLYGRKIAPIKIRINKSYNPLINKNIKYAKDVVYDMICLIKSIDDSYFRIVFIEKNLEELITKRMELMKWVSSKPIINGEDFLQKCIELGADETTKEYN